MATGDQQDFVTKLRALLPRGWFGESTATPYLAGVLAGVASFHAAGFAWVAFAGQQLRLATTSGDLLDELAADFLGSLIARRAGESDTAFRVRIRREILRSKATRQALIDALTELTGQVPIVFEPRRPADTGGYNTGSLGYGVAGGYGSYTLPFQYFVTVYRPHVSGIPNVPGYNTAPGGYGAPSNSYISAADTSGVSDADIYECIERVRPAATICWVRLTNLPPVAGGQLLDDSFILDESALA